MFPLSALLIAGTAVAPLVVAGLGPAVGQQADGIGPAPAQMSPAPLSEADAAAAARAAGKTLFPVPSGKTVWLQEVRTDNLPGTGPMERFRFVMPSLADRVPPYDPAAEANAPLSPEDEAALNDGSLQGIAVAPGGPEGMDGMDGPLDGAYADGPEIEIAPAQPGAPAAGTAPDDEPDGTMIPDTAFDTPVEAPPEGTEAAADEQLALPAAPDVLMQDPVHGDAVWLCENVVLPQIAKAEPRPSQVVISLGSAESEFGTFDPAIVQLFEAFSIPRDRDECLWEPW